MSFRKLTIIFAALALSFDASAAGAWRITATLLHDGQPFATPSAVVTAGMPATLAVDGANGYRLSLAVEELAAGKLKVRTGLASTYGAISPELVVLPGQAATVSIGDLGIEFTAKPATD